MFYKALNVAQSICDFYFKFLLIIAAAAAVILPWSALFYLIWLNF